MRKKRHSDTERMHLHGLVKLAAEGCAASWPLHTFIARSPLHGLESLRFEEALLEGRKRFGAKGYLLNECYRDYLRSGRILQKDLDIALKEIVSDTTVILGDRNITHLEVLRAHFLNGFSGPSMEILERTVENHSDRATLYRLSDILSPSLHPIGIAAQMDSQLNALHGELGKGLTLSACLDRIFGTTLVETIDNEMIKWCRPFLDEGHAPWEMASREKGFYSAWKKLALYERSWGGIPKIQEKVKALPDRADDALLISLDTLGLPKNRCQDYLGLHLAALPGWTAFMKWRSENHDYTWQEAYPITLLQYLAVRLWYESRWIEKVCPEIIGIEGSFHAVLDFATSRTAEFFLRSERRAMRLPPMYAEAVDHLCYLPLRSEDRAWQDLAERYADAQPKQRHLSALSAAWRLYQLAEVLDIAPETLVRSEGKDLLALIAWLDAAPETSHGPVWLKAFEAAYQKDLLQKLVPKVKGIGQEKPTRLSVQAVFCIDIRSESFRRHLEAVGDYETFGFAGFFAVFMRYIGFGSHREIDLFPAVVKAKHLVREIPRPFQEDKVNRHRAGVTFIHAAHTLLHDLKENVITPYVMVESIGWFFGLPLIGKTLFPKHYHAWTRKLGRFLAPPVPTTFTIEKHSRETVEGMIADEQRMMIRDALRFLFNKSKESFSEDIVELLRKWALFGENDLSLSEAERAKVLSLFRSLKDADVFIQSLRNQNFVTEAWTSARMERITRSGFTLKEQVFTVETALRMMGLTKDFARLVLLCGHGSTSDNNPYEAALDCGACGGNPGSPNARVFAMLANNADVRSQLQENGVSIPNDTYFIAGQHDTTTDAVVLYDRQDLPESHKADLEKLIFDLEQAGRRNSLERCRRFPEIHSELTEKKAVNEVMERSATWSQTRPEWGLSGNAAMIISRGSLVKGLDLKGRVFLHSYKHEEDPSGMFLEMILTGPQVVAQWINMEYYFSTTDNDIYGSGSKIYHNVVGRNGIMYGAESDLRMGLPLQTVSNGPRPFHEPMRLVTIVEAPRKRLEMITSRHRVLQDHFHNAWVHLIVLDGGHFYRYLGLGMWCEEELPLSNTA